VKFLNVQQTRAGKPLDLSQVEPLIKQLGEQYRLLLCYVFGSYASDNASTLSDLDIAVLTEHELAPKELLAITEEFQEIFQEEAIDLVDLRKVPLTLIHRVLRDGRCLYARDLRTRIEHEMRWETLYFDAEPLRRQSFEALRERLDNGTFGHR
jgi:predicted nucleotidyltransferase